MTSDHSHIRKATPADSILLADFASRAFQEAYHGLMDQADIIAYCNKTFDPKLILSEILLADRHFHLFFSADELTGYTKLRYDRSRPEFDGIKAIEMERIYVSGNHYREGIGAGLFHHAIAFSRENGFEIIWLAVWQKNDRALSFYKKEGMKIFGIQSFTVGSIVNEDYVLKLVL